MPRFAMLYLPTPEDHEYSRWVRGALPPGCKIVAEKAFAAGGSVGKALLLEWWEFKDVPEGGKPAVVSRFDISERRGDDILAHFVCREESGIHYDVGAWVAPPTPRMLRERARERAAEVEAEIGFGPLGSKEVPERRAYVENVPRRAPWHSSGQLSAASPLHGVSPLQQAQNALAHSEKALADFAARQRGPVLHDFTFPPFNEPTLTTMPPRAGVSMGDQQQDDKSRATCAARFAPYGFAGEPFIPPPVPAAPLALMVKAALAAHVQGRVENGQFLLEDDRDWPRLNAAVQTIANLQRRVAERVAAMAPIAARLETPG